SSREDSQWRKPPCLYRSPPSPPSRRPVPRRSIPFHRRVAATIGQLASNDLTGPADRRKRVSQCEFCRLAPLFLKQLQTCYWFRLGRSRSSTGCCVPSHIASLLLWRSRALFRAAV